MAQRTTRWNPVWRARRTRPGPRLTLHKRKPQKGVPATPIGVPQVQKAETHQLNLKRVLQLEGPEYLARKA